MRKKTILPVTVLSSFIGVGKFTLLNHIHDIREGRRVAVIVNDMYEVNIDAELVRDGGAQLSRAEENLIEMSNGCIFCTLREDLLFEITRLSNEVRFDYLLIETTGISETMPMAETFTFRDGQGRSLSNIARLDTMMTVVDNFNSLRGYGSCDYLHDRGESMGGKDGHTVVDLLVEQIEFCDMVVLNKAHLDCVRLTCNLLTLNPRADIIPVHFDKMQLNRVLNNGRLDFEEAASAPGWLQELRGTRVPETVGYGITSFVYRASRQFDPQRFWDLVGSEWPGVIWNKGYFMLATSMAFAGERALADGICRHQAEGMGLSAVDCLGWPDDDERRKRILETLEEPFGDRLQELALIGIGMARQAFKTQLDACLLTNAEMALEPAHGHALTILSRPGASTRKLRHEKTRRKRRKSLRDCLKNIVGMGTWTPSEWAGLNVECVQ